MIKLKPCPFCGGRPLSCVNDGTETKFGVICFACGGSISATKDSLEEAAEAWNRRAGEQE